MIVLVIVESSAKKKVEKRASAPKLARQLRLDSTRSTLLFFTKFPFLDFQDLTFIYFKSGFLSTYENKLKVKSRTSQLDGWK